MKYLMFVYGKSETQSSEDITYQIAKELQPIVISDQIKYIFGDNDSIFHFESELKFEEMSLYCDLLIQDLEVLQDFIYILIPFKGDISSNIDEEKFLYLMDVYVPKKRKKNKNIINFDDEISRKFKVNEDKMFDMFVNMMNHNNQNLNVDLEIEEICNMTLDDLLDKISEKGINSLTNAERNKLDEYSQN